MGSARRAAGLFLVLFLLTGLAATPALAVDLYWDTNSTVGGSGAATGTWGTDSFWNDDPAGGSGTFGSATTNADNLYIAAGTNGTTGTITVNGAQSANKLTLDDNVAITVSGGTSITVGGGGTNPGIYQTSAILSGTNNTISTPVILGANAKFQNDGNGALTISGPTGTANLETAANGTADMTLSGTTNNAGTITNSGSGYNQVSFAAGSNVTAITQNSLGSKLNGSTLAVNAGGTTLVNNGYMQVCFTGAVSGTGNLTLQNNSGNNFGIQLGGAVGNTGTLTNSGTGRGTVFINGSVGATVAIVQNSASSALLLSNTGNAPSSITLTSGMVIAAMNNNVTNVTGTGPIYFNGGILAYGTRTNGSFDPSSRFNAASTGDYKIDIPISSSTYATALSRTGVGLHKYGGGSLTLSAAAAYTGTTTIGGIDVVNQQMANGGTLQINSSLNGSTGTDLTFLGTGSFIVNQNVNANQGMGALTLTSGDGTVQSNLLLASNSVTFSSLAARGVGGTGNFVISGGANGTTNKIVLGGVTANAFIDKGVYYGGSNYGWYDAGGYVRAIAYGSDAGTATTGAIGTVPSATHQEVTGAVSAQQTASFTTLKLVNTANSNQDLSLLSGETVTADSILVSGGSGTLSRDTIRGGTALRPSLNAELVVRTDVANDRLILENFQRNGTNALTKSGAGTLSLTGQNTIGGSYGVNGNIAINAGSLLINSEVDTTYTGQVSGGGMLEVTGPGKVTLAPSSPINYTGGTMVNGTLVLDFSNMATPVNMLFPGITGNKGSGVGSGQVRMGGQTGNVLRGPQANSTVIVKGKPGAYSTYQQLGANGIMGSGGNFNAFNGVARLLIDPNGGTDTTVSMGFHGNSRGAIILIGKAPGAGTGNYMFTTGNAAIDNIYFTNDGGVNSVDFMQSKDLRGSTDGTVVLFPLGTNGTSYTEMTASSSGSFQKLTGAYVAANGVGGVLTKSTNLNQVGIKFEDMYDGQVLDCGGQSFGDIRAGLLMSGSGSGTFTVRNGNYGISNAKGNDMYFGQFASNQTLNWNVPITENWTSGYGDTVTKSGPGTMIMSAANNYWRATYINEGILQAGIAEVESTPSTAGSGPFGTKSYPNSSVSPLIHFSGGILQYSSVNNYDYSWRFNTAGNQPIKIDTNGRDVTFATNIVGAGTSLTKLGEGKLTLTQSGNTYTAGVSALGGTLQLNHEDAIPVPAGTAGQPLYVGDGGKVLLNNGLAKAVQVSKLGMYGDTAPTGTIDIQQGQLVVDGRVTSKDTLKAQIGSAYNINDPENPWQGPGITSSAAAADAVKYAVGYAFNGDYGEIAWTTWFGRTVSTDSLLVRFTYMGDADLSGEVTTDDFDNWKQGYVLQRNPTWLTGDFDYSGDITTDDFDLWKQTYVKHYTPLPSGAGGGGAVVTSAVPEPGTLVLLASGAAALALVLWRRRAK